MTTITSFSSEQAKKHLEQFVNVLKLTVDGGASIGWVAPISLDEAQDYWSNICTQVDSGNKVLLVALQDDVVVGTVQLALEPRENGNHRGEVQKLMVHPDFRRQGIARQLMEQLDIEARTAKRTLLVLDVRTGDAAVNLYKQMGFLHVGDIPNYARRDANIIDPTSFYYKELS